MNPIDVSSAKVGVLVGGSGLIGGAITHYFKTKADGRVELLAPNSKKLSLREPDDIRRYFKSCRPDFIINAAIAAIDSDPLLAYETNYLGSVSLARVALDLGIPYIHFSSAAVLPHGENLTEDDHLPLSPDLSNYAKSKLMAETTIRHLGATQGLDYTIVRLAVVYGKHDHKIQGFHRLFFSIVDQAMPFMVTKRGVLHSYSNSKKVPPFVHHVLENRAEFSGQIINFVDRLPVELATLVLTIRAYLELNFPKAIYLPYPLAKGFSEIIRRLLRALRHVGVEARMPAELMFLESFYQTQTLSARKLEASSFVDPMPGTTVLTYLPDMIEYYLTRWEHLNLIEPFNKEFFDPKKRSEEFLRSPETLLATIHEESRQPFTNP